MTRALLKRKRKSDLDIDEAEDGGRAIVIEEGVSALVFAYATDHNYLDEIEHLDQKLLDMIKLLVARTEAGVRSAADWEAAILDGYEMFRQLVAHDGGSVEFDSAAQRLTYTQPRTLTVGAFDAR